MKKRLLFTTVSILILSTSILAQETIMKDSTKRRMNYFKVNLSALVITNISLQYERILNKRFSVALGFGNMPLTSLPYKNTIIKYIGDDEDTQEQINNFKMSSSSITPEVRLYVGKKGYGRGFYLAPFYKYATYKGSGLEYFYETNSSEENSLTMSGKLTGSTFGLLLGVQYSLGKHLSLDTYLGPNYGTGTGEFTGTSATPLSLEEQEDLRQDLEDFEIPLTNKTITVNASGATVKLDGPFGGLRFGFALGWKF